MLPSILVAKNTPFDSLALRERHFKEQLRLAKGKIETPKKDKYFCAPLPELVKGGSLIRAPFDTLSYSGSGASNYNYA
jgi:hypothetical protein